MGCFSPFLETTSALKAFEMALKTGYKPWILNSDQGCQFTSQAWVWKMVEHKIEISMDGKGRCLDNIHIERFWRSVKYEEVYLKTYDSVGQARLEIGEYIAWYNALRPHQSLGNKTPNEIFKENLRDCEDKSLTYPPHSPRSTTSKLRKCLELKKGNRPSLKNAA